MTLMIAGFSLLAGCSTLSVDHDPVLHSPFSASRWRTTPPGGVPADNVTETTSDIRRQAVEAALALLTQGDESTGYGERDLTGIFEAIGADIRWQPQDSLSSLVDLGRKKGAYHTDGYTRPGDIVCFHNQRDANNNGENDDWFTGAGIVIDSYQTRFEAVARTGHAPRRIFGWPDRASLRLYKGDTANSFVRVPQRTDPVDTAYLAGQLYAGHLDIEKLLSQ